MRHDEVHPWNGSTGMFTQYCVTDREWNCRRDGGSLDRQLAHALLGLFEPVQAFVSKRDALFVGVERLVERGRVVLEGLNDLFESVQGFFE